MSLDDPDVRAYLASKPFSTNYARAVRGTLGEAFRSGGGKPLRSWTNEDALKLKGEMEGRLHFRSLSVKWGILASYFAWLSTTGKAPANAKGRALALAGIELPRAEDRKMATLKDADLVRLVDHLAERAAALAKSARGYERRRWMVKARRDLAESRRLEFVHRVVLLQFRHGLRGGELLPTERSRPKTLCDCPVSAGDECPERPTPHDFRVLSTPERPQGAGVPDGDAGGNGEGETENAPVNGRATVSFRIKGEPKAIRFKAVVLTSEELGWVKGLAGPGCPMILRSYNEALKGVQAALGLKLVNRSDVELPIGEAPLTSHTLRRTLGRRLTKARVPEYVANPLMGWSKRSQQLRRYGELSPMEVADATRGVTDLGAMRRAAGRQAPDPKPAPRPRRSRAPPRPKAKPSSGPSSTQAKPTTLGEMIAADPKLREQFRAYMDGQG